MDGLIAVGAAVISTAFTLDLARSYRRRPRPHTAAYGVGMALFAIATWALAAGLTFGWTGFSYRTFFLFGAILNIPLLALGSMYLVVGKRAGTITFLLVGAIAAISTTLTTTVAFAAPLPTGGIPHEIFPPISEGFGPRLLAAIAGGLAATVIIILSLVSIFRFWKKNQRVVWGNLLITAGTFAAAWGGTGLAVGEGAAFAISLLLAASLIWAGYRVASGARRALAVSAA
ncbi:MAG TPA: hypothetical protein VM470_05745 [Acidimicrobiia bacterium]|nr:hypothetical protein [Acidimicrobiia bacterium]